MNKMFTRINLHLQKNLPRGGYLSIVLIMVLTGTMLEPFNVNAAGPAQVVANGLKNRIPAAAYAVFTVTGRVTDAGGEPIPGVSITVKGGTASTVTNAEGNFKLVVADGKKTLVFRYIGYEVLEMAIKDRPIVNAVLTSTTTGLDEVVVVAYGKQKKSDITGSVSTIKAESIESIPVVSIEELFKGQVAGVQSSMSSGTPGSASNVNIRGVSSIGASTQPLYVIDGLPITGQAVETGFSEARTGMDFINPNDIESIEVLKDASATAIYGARGANGVILITTKSGKAGTSKAVFSAAQGLTTMANKIDMMTTREAQEYFELAKARIGRIEAPLALSDIDKNVDWQKITSQKALRQNYNMNFQGGQDKLQYFLSLDYLAQEGLLKYTNYNKYGMRTNLSSQINNKLKVENRFTFSRSKNDGSFTGGQGGTSNATGVTQRILQAPTYRQPNEQNPGVDPETGEVYIDPLVILRDLSDDINVSNLTEQLTLKYKIIPGLEFQTNGSLSYRVLKNDEYQGEGYANTKNDSRIAAAVRNVATTNYLNENTLNYTKKIGSNNFTFLIGNSIQQETAIGTTINAVDFASTTTGVDALQNAKEVRVSSFKSEWQLASFFGRLNYDYKGKYLFTGTLRRDGSSKLASGNKWGTFPSLALGWRISEEGFMKKQDLISNLKLRGSWGQIGNSEIGVYQTLSTITANTGPIDNQLLPYYTLDRYADPNLKWEISQQANLGLDIELLKGKISVTAEVYDKRTKDLLLSQPTSLSAGYTSYLTNVGAMTNRGFEFTLGLQAIQKKNFKWTTNVNFSLLKNNITDLGKGGIVPIGQTVDSKSPRYLSVGKSIGAFYLVKTDGVWQLGEEAEAQKYGAVPGDWKFVDQNHDNLIDNEDRVFTGDALPKFNIGFSNTFNYKKFDLQILLTGDFGGQTLNVVKPTLWLAKKSGGAKYNLRAWSPENPTNEQAAPNLSYNSEFLHDGYLESADIIRIQNVKLGYRHKLKSLNKTLYLYFSGNNVWSWSKYDGYDPEVGNGISRGIDRFAYPRGRVYNFGAQFSF